MQFTLNAYIHNSSTLTQVQAGEILPVFARDQERMETSGFKRIGVAHIVVRLEDDIDAAIRGAGVGAVGVEA